MFDINIKFDNLEIKNIEKYDLDNVYEWFKNEIYFLENSRVNYLDKEEFYERFLEYYVSECEFFLKINKDDKLIGIIKGRMEFKNPNELWLSYYILDHSVRNKGIGTLILKVFIDYLSKECGIENFYIKINKKDLRCIDFWKNHRFKSDMNLEDYVILKKHVN